MVTKSPIPDSEYDHTIGLLEAMGIGSPTVQDCRVDRVDSPYPILNRLVTQSVNVDELNFVGASSISFASASGESSLISLLLPLQIETATLGFNLVVV